VLAAPILEGPIVVTSPYGAQENFRRKPHSGVDLRAAPGTRVYSPGHGVVRMADGEDDGEDSGGLEVVFALDNGWKIGFAHLSLHAVGVGERLPPGIPFAETGATGIGITGPHLHVTMRNPSGARVDPLPHLLAAAGAAGGGGAGAAGVGGVLVLVAGLAFLLARA
jgi:murein DD-endopeptidase MepM/ murein hydrolase activator NlpD